MVAVPGSLIIAQEWGPEAALVFWGEGADPVVLGKAQCQAMLPMLCEPAGPAAATPPALGLLPCLSELAARCMQRS